MPPIKIIRGGAAASSGASAQGFASMSASDDNVVALWNFDETTGNFVDEVNSLALLEGTAGNANGTDTNFVRSYNIDQVTQGGPLQNVAPGVSCSYYDYIYADNFGATLNPGTGSFTIEAILEVSDQSSSTIQISTDYTAAAPNKDGFYWQIPDTLTTDDSHFCRFSLYATDGTLVSITSASNLASVLKARTGIPFHLRLVYDTDGSSAATMYIYINGVEIASQASNSLAGKTITLDDWIFWTYPGGDGLVNAKRSNIYQLRVSHNATNNGYSFG